MPFKFGPSRNARLKSHLARLANSSTNARSLRIADMRRERLNVVDRRQAEWGAGLRSSKKKSFLIGLGLGGLPELLLYWLESGSENGGGQLGYVPAVADSGFNPFLDQPLLQSDELPPGFSLRPAPCIAAVRFLAFLVANS